MYISLSINNINVNKIQELKSKLIESSFIILHEIIDLNKITRSSINHRLKRK